ncbi:tRNA:m(4)X modification enzyme TRM13 homolog [Topomyia yanbarensis]|uniref:tRNA:m(4)X modification enzyme TRM13 homolog n=1 Tax=Topomyia yanbarensis TaxID=2498891 RepID=UPI00273CF3E7|nr:tRNA:m(4)X modification enzyme TRM13 homolog [Topomyia yanbarensis]
MSTPEEPVKKRPKMTTSQPNRTEQPKQDKEEEVRCRYFVQRKKRYCKMTVGRGKLYCGEHEVSAPASESATSTDRIPCPLDPKHSISSAKLEKHLRICNARARELPAYIEPGINSRSDSDEGETRPNTRKLADVSLEDLRSLVEKVTEIYETDSRINCIEELLLEHAIFKEELANESYGPQTLKHLIQSASLLGIVKHERFFQKDTAFVEFGAGKGQVAFWLASIIQQSSSDLTNAKVLLVDKASHRHKQDNRIEDRQIVYRIRADIADLVLRKLDMLQSCKSVIGVGKHLCGGATDLALRCLVRANRELPNESGQFRSEGFVFALCCHHRCDWKTYVGKKFLLSKGIGHSEFELIVRMVSWAVCGSGTSREKRKQTETDDCVKYGFTRTEREVIGRKCKRVLDLGRLDYLALNGFTAHLKYYAKSDITLENVCLIGHVK